MFKQNIIYTDFNDREVTETLRFNLSKSELLDQDELKESLEEMAERFGTVERELTSTEIKEIVGLIKHFMELSYGVMADLDGTPNENGKRFMKSPEIWETFTQTAAYDAYIMSLFENSGSGAIQFMTSIIPKDLQEQVAQAQADQRALTQQTGQAISQSTAEMTPVAPVLEKAPDIEALLAEMPSEAAAPKEPIARHQAEYLKTKLSADQYAAHMSNKVIID